MGRLLDFNVLTTHYRLLLRWHGGLKAGVLTAL
jgi:hypothetical protein